MFHLNTRVIKLYIYKKKIMINCSNNNLFKLVKSTIVEGNVSDRKYVLHQFNFA